MSKPFDFSALDLTAATDKPFEFEIKHPHSYEGLGVFVSVVGAESATFQTYMRNKVNQVRMDSLRKQRSSKPDEIMTAEQEEDEIIAAMTACLTGWRTVTDGKSEPVVLIAGEKFEFTPANAARWLKQFRWVRQQINDATADLGNFIQA